MNKQMQSQQEDVRTNERFRIGVGLCTDIGHCTTQMDSTKYRWLNVRHESWDNWWRFFGYVLNSSSQKVTKLAFQRKSKKAIFCPCIVWKKWNFDQSITEQRAFKKSKNTIFGFTLLRSVSEFDRGQPNIFEKTSQALSNGTLGVTKVLLTAENEADKDHHSAYILYIPIGVTASFKITIFIYHC